MTNDKSAEEIVRGLLGYCKYEVTGHGERWARVDIFDLQQAADLVESLQAQLEEWKSKHRQAALNYQQKCQDVVELEAQLAASQQETRALLDDIAHDMACGICAHCSVSLVNEPCASCRGNPSKFEWRGHQAAKEETKL